MGHYIPCSRTAREHVSIAEQGLVLERPEQAFLNIPELSLPVSSLAKAKFLLGYPLAAWEPCLVTCNTHKLPLLHGSAMVTHQHRTSASDVMGGNAATARRRRDAIALH